MNETVDIQERLNQMEKKLDRLTRLMESQQNWQGRVGDFVEEMSPVARAMMDSGIVEFARLEERGYFRLGADLMEALDRFVETYQPGSLPALADGLNDVVMILRMLSQPRILAAAQDVAEGFDKAGSEPIEMLGAAKRVETEKDIQRGIAFALDLFSTLGRSVSRAPRLRRAESAPVVSRPRSTPIPAARASSAQAQAQAPSESCCSVEFSFVPDAEWSRDWAEATAQSLGVAPLDERKWTIVEYSRSDYKENKKAPNIRRITKALDISTKDIYALFPSAPGPTISKIAGVPKPAGCL